MTTLTGTERLIAILVGPAGATVLALVLTVVVVFFLVKTMMESEVPLVREDVALIRSLDNPEGDGDMQAELDCWEDERRLEFGSGKRYACWLAREVQSKYGLKPRSEAQDAFYREKINQLMRLKKDLRHEDRVSNMDMAIELCYVPTKQAIAAAKFGAGMAVISRRVEMANARRGWRWVPCCGWIKMRRLSLFDTNTHGRRPSAI